MFLENCPNRGHDYWIVARAVREGNRVHNQTALYLGRLDTLTPERRTDLERKVTALGNPKLLLAFHLKLAQLGHPIPSHPSGYLAEDGPFSLSAVNFRTLNEALGQEDLTSRDLAALVSRIGLPLRPEELLALGVRVEAGKKTSRSISLYYRRTSSPRPGSAPAAKGGSRPRRRSTGGSRASGPP